MQLARAIIISANIEGSGAEIKTIIMLVFHNRLDSW